MTVPFQLLPPPLVDPREFKVSDGVTVGVERGSSGAAGVYSGVLVIPGKYSILRLSRVRVGNLSESSGAPMTIRLFRWEDWNNAAVVLGAERQLAILSLRPPLMAGDLSESKCVAVTVTDPNSRGLAVARVDVEPKGGEWITLPGRGVELWGNSPNGAPALYIGHHHQVGLGALGTALGEEFSYRTVT